MIFRHADSDCCFRCDVIGRRNVCFWNVAGAQGSLLALLPSVLADVDHRVVAALPLGVSDVPKKSLFVSNGAGEKGPQTKGRQDSN